MKQMTGNIKLELEGNGDFTINDINHKVELFYQNGYWIRRRNWFIRFIRLPFLVYRHYRITKDKKMAIKLALLSIKRIK